MSIIPHPALIARDEYLRLGIALVVHELYGHTYPAKHRHNARLNILSTWMSSTPRDGLRERAGLVTALAYLTTPGKVRTSLAGTPPTCRGRAAGLRYLLARMTPGGVEMVRVKRDRSDERDAVAVTMADGLLDALPELVDHDALETWAAVVADWEREHTGLWVVDLLESGYDPFDVPDDEDDGAQAEEDIQALEDELYGTRRRLSS